MDSKTIGRSSEDLFEQTRMSFGEHLEELRKVLVRALIGVAIGSMIGLYFGNQIIGVLLRPLNLSIEKFNQSLARKEIAAETGWVPAEFDVWFEQGLIPKRSLVDPAQLKRLMADAGNATSTEEDFGRVQFTGEEIPVTSIRAVCQRLVAVGSTSKQDETKESTLWNWMNQPQQELVRKLADLEGEPKAEDAGSLLQIFNQLLDFQELRNKPSFQSVSGKPSSLGTWLGGATEDDPIVQIQAKLVNETTGELSRQLNKYLIHRAFADLLPPLRAGLVPLTTWHPVNTRAQSLAMTEPFMIWMKAGIIAGLFLSSPWVFYQIWTFVAAGLYPHEQKYVHLYLPMSLGLFLSGILLAYFFVFDPVLQFMLAFNADTGIDPQPRVSEWLSFVLMLPLGFGLAFQLPLVMLFLNRIGLIAVSQYLAKWRIAVLIIFVLAMVLTPADPISMLLLAIPLTILYFLGVALCQWMPAHRNPFVNDPVAMS